MGDEGPPEGFDPDLEELGGLEGLKKLRPGTQVLKRLGKMYSVLSSSNRIEVLYYLNFSPLTPSELSELTGMAPNLLSFHLKKLEKAGVISGERNGKNIIYSITDLGRSLTGPLTR
ncbi:MAG: ArsR/SmtB family transcription factor [Thermoplasmatota archaeon]